MPHFIITLIFKKETFKPTTMRKILQTLLFSIGFIFSSQIAFSQCLADGGTIQPGIDQIVCPGSMVGISLCGYTQSINYTTVILVTDQAGNVLDFTNQFHVIGACATAYFQLPEFNSCNECYNFYGFNFLNGVSSDPIPANINTLNCAATCCDLSEVYQICTIDNTPPVGIAPDDIINLPCDATIPDVDISLVEVIDDCSTPNFAFKYDFHTGSGCPDDPLRVERVFSMIDECGNTDDFRQVFAFIAPVLRVECSTIPVACVEDITHAPEIVIDSVGCGIEYDIQVEFIKINEIGGPNCDLTCYHYKYDITDGCGQFDSCTKIYVIVGEGPEFVDGIRFEEDLRTQDTFMLQCDPYDDVVIANWLDSKEAVGQCMNNVVSITNTYDPDNLEGGCDDNTGSQLITFYAEDECGRIDSCLAVLVMVDTIPPADVAYAKDKWVNCSDDFDTIWNEWLDNNGGAISIDKCSSISWTTDPVDPQYDIACSDMEEGITVTFTASDECGNTFTSSAMFKILNDGPPMIDVEAMDLTVNCGDDFDQAFVDWIASNGGAEATGCGDLIWTSDPADPSFDVCDNDGGTTVTFTATDECDQMVSTSATFFVSDSEAPTVTDASDLDIDCSAATDADIQAWLDNAGGSVAMDDCTDVTWTNDYNGLTETCPGMGSVTVIFTATDECGNEASTSATINVMDNEAPDVSNVPTEFSLECSDGNVDDLQDYLDGLNNTIVTDNCSEVTFTHDFDGNIDEDPDCPGTGSALVNFTATDECGNESTGSITVSIVDTTPPVFGSIPVMKEDDITATDACSDVNITFIDDVIDGEDCTCTRTWTATDACGNSSTVSGTVTGEDGIAPVITWDPNDLNVACGSDVDPSVVTATDNSGGVDLTWVLISGTDDCSIMNGGQVVYEYTAVDACGNMAMQTITFNVAADFNPPVFDDFPLRFTFYCSDGVVWPDPVVNDDCSDVTVTCETFLHVPNVDQCNEVNGETFGYDLDKLWTAVDACGNTSTLFVSAWVVPDDYIGPKFNFVPEDMEMGCGEEATFGEAICTSKCGDVVLTFEDVVHQGDCTEGGEFTRIWTGVDACGNKATAQQVITVPADTEAPLFTYIPEDKVSACFDEVTFGTPVCEDNCATINHLDISYEDVSLEEACGIKRVWTVSDMCGNVSIAEQTITLNDQDAPAFEAIQTNKQISCGQAQQFDEPTVIDGCGDFTLTHHDEIVNENCTGQEGMQRTWYAEDVCGNKSQFTQLLEIVDLEGPQFSSISSTKWQACGTEIQFDQPEVMDICGEVVSLEFVDNDEVEADCDNCIGMISRTWTATDNCGNLTNFVQEVYLEDNIQPAFSDIPSEIVVDCGGVAVYSEPEIIDNCGLANNWHIDETLEGNCQEGKVMIRTWYAEDHAGNLSSVSQKITTIDQQAPQIETVLVDKNVNCGEAVDFDMIEATDACSEVEVTFVDSAIDQTCANSMTTERVWTVSDLCGNESTITQTISISDTEAPELSELVPVLYLSCNDSFEFDTPTATDNCSELEITFVENELTGFCEGLRSAERIWTATDVCGNAETVTQKIVIEDVTPPIFDNIPEDAVISCGESVVFGEPMVSDECSTVTISFEDYTEQGDCFANDVYIRSWTILDQCGNLAFASQKIERVMDQDAPMLTNTLENATVNCNDSFEFDTPDFEDNCSDVDVSFVETTNTEDCTTIHTREWKAIDACGNETIVSQSFVQTDLEAPIFETVLENVEMTFAEYQSFVEPQVIANDNCGVAEMLGPDITEVGDCMDYRFTHSYTAVDGCGLNATASHEIIITDAEPLFEILPIETVDCGEELEILIEQLSSMPSVVGWELTAGGYQGWFVLDNDATSARLISGEGTATLTIKSENDLGCVVEKSIDIDCQAGPTSTNAIRNIESIAIAPNPVADVLNLNFISKQGTALNISIVDMLGRNLVDQQMNVNTGYNNLQLTVDQLVQGAYFIHLSNGQEQQAIKFIKQ